jgi:hypothetical protein
MSKYGSVFKAKEISEKSGNLESMKSGNLENEKLVNLGVKIPAWQRNYWVGKAKSQGKTISSIIIESLTERLGDPQ